MPERTYCDIAELERAIAVSFGGFVRGRGLIGLIYGIIILVAAFVLGVPFAPLIAVVAGLIVFIPWIGPLHRVGGAAGLCRGARARRGRRAGGRRQPDRIDRGPAGRDPARHGRGREYESGCGLSVVIIGTALAGIMGAVFAIPTAAAILAITDYLRERDVLLRAEGFEPPDTPSAPPPTPATMGTAG